MKKYFLIMFLVLLANTGIIALVDFVDNNFNDLNSSEYCFAYWTPGVGYWQDECYSDKKTCEEAFSESKSIDFRRHNTEECYEQEFVDAYCVYEVISGDIVYDEISGKETYKLVNVCTLDLSECKKYEKFSIKNSHCEQKTGVNTKESKNDYLTPKHELEDIINKITNLVSSVNHVETETNKISGCVKYKASPNQQIAFENLGLNWNKTKKWGAFVDVNGNLRANRPSCRLIERNSIEYNRYK